MAQSYLSISSLSKKIMFFVNFSDLTFPVNSVSQLHKCLEERLRQTDRQTKERYKNILNSEHYNKWQPDKIVLKADIIIKEQFYKGILKRIAILWSFLYNSFVKST